MGRLLNSDLEAMKAKDDERAKSAAEDNSPMLRRVGKAMFPKGFKDSDEGSLDKSAALNGEIVKNGEAMDREQMIAEIGEKLQKLADIDLMELSAHIDELAMKPATQAPAPVASKDEAMAPREIVKPAAGIVDTGVLTGPRAGLKNFLVKKSQDSSEGM